MQKYNRYKHAIEMKSESAVTMELTLARPHRRRIETESLFPEPVQTKTPNRIPRITRLMALAIKFQGMVERGEVRDYADLARLGHVSRARITQIMNLLNLASAIQEEILRHNGSSKTAPERQIRCLTAELSWKKQLQRWNGPEQIA